MSKSIVLHRYAVSQALEALGWIERTRQKVNIGTNEPLTRCSFFAVAARHVDVLWDERIGFGGDQVALEIVGKRGKYDGAQRRRYAFRCLPEPTMRLLQPANLCLYRDSGRLWVRITPEDDPQIIESFPLLRHDAHAGNLSKIAGWKLAHYYTHLANNEPQTTAAIQAWAQTEAAEMVAAGNSAAALNRAADRMLYRLSRDLGWRKLTLRERQRMGMAPESPQWHRIADIDAWHVAHGYASRIASEGNEMGRPDQWAELEEQYS